MKNIERLARTVDKRAAGLSLVASFLLVVLASHADADGSCFPSQELLSREMGSGLRSVRKGLAELRRRELLVVVQGRRHHTPNTYRLDAQRLASLPRASLRGTRPEVAAEEPETGTTCRSDDTGDRHVVPVSDRHDVPVSEQGDRHHAPVRPARGASSDRHHAPLEAPVEDPIKHQERGAPSALALVGTFEEAPKAKKRRRKATSADPAVMAVFDAWVEARKPHHPMGPRPVLDKNRQKFIRERLEDGFDVETLKRATRGIWRSDWHLGENDRGTEYADLRHCLGDASKVERFAALGDTAVPTPPPPPPPRPVNAAGVARVGALLEGIGNGGAANGA